MTPEQIAGQLTEAQRAEGWIAHDGGGSPVERSGGLWVKFRDGDEWQFNLPDQTSDSIWRWQGAADDIIAYRPEKQNG